MTTTAIVAVFKDRNQAYDAAQEIRRLEADDVGFTVNAGILLGKDAKGNVAVLEEAERPLWGTGTGLVVGGLIGLLAGPLGTAAGAAIGGLSGLTADAVGSDLDVAFADSVTQDLSPSDTALLLEADEGSTAAVDTIVARHGGRIHRAPV